MTAPRQPTKSEHGAVTAEFVMVLPVVMMILGICLGSIGLQLERMKLVSAAAAVSRAVARGEPQEKLTELLDGRKIGFKNTVDYICAELSAEFVIPGLAGLPFEISDTECARRQGF